MRFNNQSFILPIIGVNVVMFILQLFAGGWFTNIFILDPALILIKPWSIITSMFLHGGPNHIFFNMYGLFLFGPLLEQKIGSKRFLMVYFSSGIAAALGHIVLSNLIFGSAARALGASGAIMGILGTLIILMPELKLLFMFAIPMPLYVAGIIWALIDFVGIFIPSGVANIAHLMGMGTGLLFGLYFKNVKKKYYREFSKKTSLNKYDVDEYLRSGRI